jgi:bisphosphoglycerate-dependent phosphoglycerate mutase
MQKVKKGWFSNKTIEKYTAFPQFESIIDLNKLNDTRLNIFNLRNNNNYIFFLTRHGEGVHNTMKTTEKMKNQSLILNAPLTPKGVEQAKNAGTELNDYLKGARIQPIDFTFASDLQRAQYTVAHMFMQLERRFINPTYRDIYILPCSHEIVGDKGNCDNAGDITWAENTPTKLDVDNILNKKLNWKYYDMNFSRINKKNKTKQCKSTNMFTEMINIIDDETTMGLSPNRFDGGKTRRKR